MKPPPKKLPWGSITTELQVGGVKRFRARSGDERRAGLGYYDTWAEAAEALSIERERLRVESWLEGRASSLIAYGRAWFERDDVRASRRALAQERTRFERHIAIAPFAQWPIAHIEPRDVQRWVRSLSTMRATHPAAGEGATISRETVKRAVALLRSIFATAIVDGLIDESPARELVIQRSAQREEAWTWLRQDEIDAVLSCERVSVRSRAWFAVAIFAGLRAGELAGLRWGRTVGLDGPTPEIIVARSRDGATKSGRVRRVPLLRPAAEWLRRWRGGRRVADTDLVWPGADGAPHAPGYDAGWAHLSADGPGARELAGITRPVRLHDLRHTCGSQLVSGREWTARGWLTRPLRVEEVREWLGHSSLAMTLRYAHLAPEAMRSAVVQATDQTTDRELPKNVVEIRRKVKE